MVSVRDASSRSAAVTPAGRVTSGKISPVTAWMETPLPTEPVTRRLFSTTASTSLATSLMALDTPTETATPTEPTPRASDTAPATEEIALSSRANTETSRASMRESLSIRAEISVAMRLSTPTPAPATPTPTEPAATAAEPDRMRASMVWVLFAVTSTEPEAVIWLLSISAVTLAPDRVRSMRCQARVSR